MASVLRDQSVVVIGAGIAGLAAGWKLGSAGCGVSILEARDRTGGRVWTVPDGFPVELGAEFIHGRPREIFTPLDEAAAKITEVEGRSWCAFENQLRPCDFWSSIDSILSRMDDSKPDESFLDFLTRLFPNPDTNRKEQDRAIGYVSGFNAADPALVGVHWLVQGMRAEEKIEGEHSFRAGNGYRDLLEILEKRIAACPDVKIHTSAVVESVNWQQQESEVVANTASGPQKIRGSRIVITVPLALLKAPRGEPGVVNFNPPLPAEKIAALDRLEMGKVIRTVLRFRDRFWDHVNPQSSKTSLSDMGFLFSNDEWFPTWWTSAPRRLPIITGWAPFECAEKLSGRNREFVIDRGLHTLGRLLKVDRHFLQDNLQKAYFHDRQTDPFSRGAYSYGKVGSDGAQEALAAPLNDRLFFAGEATDKSGNNGTVHGAMASGYRAANQVLQSFR
jgi:monoamine oxidase